jgi:hypothetical protein
MGGIHASGDVDLVIVALPDQTLYVTIQQLIRDEG